MPCIGWHLCYIFTTVIGYILMLIGGVYMVAYAEEQHDGRPLQRGKRVVHAGDQTNGERVFRKPPHSLLLQKRWNKGYINVVNPFRASIVLGTPGSGKSYAIINNFIKQQIEKGFGLYLYDYKYV